MDTVELQKIQENWKLYTNLVGKIKDEDLRKSLLEMCDTLHTRMAVSPASTRTDYIGAFPGGLVWYSLEVLKLMKDLNKLYDARISSDDLIVAALFHNLGKIGSENQDYYMPQKSDYHRKRGIVYEINPKLGNITPPTRSLWWLNRHEAKLSVETTAAILSLQNMNQMYSSELYNAPMLSIILQQAVRVTCAKNGGISNICDT